MDEEFMAREGARCQEAVLRREVSEHFEDSELSQEIRFDRHLADRKRELSPPHIKFPRFSYDCPDL